jgi:hypothetical protein
VKENISWILCNDFLIMPESKVNFFEHCIFFLVCLYTSLLKLCVFLQVFILHDGNLQAICIINFITFCDYLSLNVVELKCSFLCLVPKTQDYGLNVLWLYCEIPNQDFLFNDSILIRILIQTFCFFQGSGFLCLKINFVILFTCWCYK